jgi:hypothetical protein
VDALFSWRFYRTQAEAQDALAQACVLGPAAGRFTGRCSTMTLVDWLAVYEQDPLDFSLLLPWSDWCLEQGDERSAACLRWCHQHERSPDGASVGDRRWI